MVAASGDVETKIGRGANETEGVIGGEFRGEIGGEIGGEIRCRWRREADFRGCAGRTEAEG